MAASQVFAFKVSGLQQDYSVKCLLRGLWVRGGLEAGSPVPGRRTWELCLARESDNSGCVPLVAAGAG